MTTATRNEAAERLRSRILQGSESENDLLDEALAAERRATVERIRAAVEHPEHWKDGEGIAAILDEEAAQ